MKAEVSLPEAPRGSASTASIPRPGVTAMAGPWGAQQEASAGKDTASFTL